MAARIEARLKELGIVLPALASAWRQLSSGAGRSGKWFIWLA